MNLVDSCGWLEYFANGPNADFFDGPLEDTEQVLVPTICLFEVFKAILRRRGESEALQAAAAMHQGRLVDLDASLALAAARIGNEENLPLADAVILATARAHDATLWTQDAHFRDIEDVRFVEKR